MEEGIKKFIQLVATQGFKLWLGPTFPLLILCNPDIIRSITSASGTHAELGMMRAAKYPRPSILSSPKLPCGPCRVQAPLPASLSAMFLFPLCIHQPPCQHLLRPLPSVPAILCWAPLGAQEASIESTVLEVAPHA
uniref:Uncharacterized protein n=1 Tax=Macaca mulatta TaxID=9544 RepID=A0A5F8ACW6_MACMU